MKRLVVALCLIVIMLALSSYSLFLLREANRIVLRCADEIEWLMDEMQYDQAEMRAIELTEEWQRLRGGLTFFFHHKPLDELSGAAACLPALIQNRDKSQTEAQLAVIRDSMEDFWQDELPQPRSIF